jgi:glyoxalase family protein
MTKTMPGLHHVTAISGPPQANLAFYAGILGQKLVKRTVNFDDPATYHLYYGDAAGSPGTILTFFPFAGAAPGRPGPGMTTAVAYAIPTGDAGARFAALAEAGHPVSRPFTRFGAEAATLQDPDGLAVDLIADPEATDAHGFHSVTLWQRDPEPTARLLTDIFGYAAAGEELEPGGGRRWRFQAPGGARGSVIDLVQKDGATVPRPGRGTIHHIAFRALSDADQLDWRDRVHTAGLRPTEVIDRQYFKAIYFREPGGVLFEIATDPPGFAVDEDPAALGRALKLPPHYEAMRGRIEAVLPPLELPA